MPTSPIFDPEIDQLRSAFTRRAKLRRAAVALAWTIAVLLVVACLGWRI